LEEVQRANTSRRHPSSSSSGAEDGSKAIATPPAAGGSNGRHGADSEAGRVLADAFAKSLCQLAGHLDSMEQRHMGSTAGGGLTGRQSAASAASVAAGDGSSMSLLAAAAAARRSSREGGGEVESQRLHPRQSSSSGRQPGWGIGRPSHNSRIDRQRSSVLEQGYPCGRSGAACEVGKGLGAVSLFRHKLQRLAAVACACGAAGVHGAADGSLGEGLRQLVQWCRRELLLLPGGLIAGGVDVEGLRQWCGLTFIA
jgi:hypothetical protein